MNTVLRIQWKLREKKEQFSIVVIIAKICISILICYVKHYSNIVKISIEGTGEQKV